MSPTAGYIQLDLGHRRDQVSKTDTYTDDPTTTLRAVRVTDGDDETKTTVVQPGSPENDNEVVRREDLHGAVRTGYAVTFQGAAMVTATGEDKIFYPVGEVGSEITIEASMASSTPQGTSGTTDIRVSAAPKGGSTANSILLQLPFGSHAGYSVTTAFTVTAFDPVYVYVEDATGLHADMEINVVAKGGVQS